MTTGLGPDRRVVSDYFHPSIAFGVGTLLSAILLEPFFAGAMLTAAALSLAGGAQWILLQLVGQGGAASGPCANALQSRQDAEQAASKLSHDLRTQLSIIQLQLNKIPDPRARVAEEDIRALTGSIDQLAMLVKERV